MGLGNLITSFYDYKLEDHLKTIDVASVITAMSKLIGTSHHTETN